MNIEKTRYNNLVLFEVRDSRSRFAYLKYQNRTRVVARGAKQIKRLKDVLLILERNNIPAQALNGHFFRVLSLYFCEEQYTNYHLLFRELSRLITPGVSQEKGNV